LTDSPEADLGAADMAALSILDKPAISRLQVDAT
jgi:hypothetical protein